MPPTLCASDCPVLIQYNGVWQDVRPFPLDRPGGNERTVQRLCSRRLPWNRRRGKERLAGADTLLYASVDLQAEVQCACHHPDSRGVCCLGRQGQYRVETPLGQRSGLELQVRGRVRRLVRGPLGSWPPAMVRSHVTHVYPHRRSKGTRAYVALTLVAPGGHS
jgi:hypothetical protein